MRKIKIVDYLTGLSFKAYKEFKEAENERAKKNDKTVPSKVGLSLFIGILTAADEVLKMVIRAVYKMTKTKLKIQDDKNKFII